MHLIICHTKKRDAEVCEDSLDKAGAVSTVCQAGTAVNVRIANILQCKVCNLSAPGIIWYLNAFL